MKPIEIYTDGGARGNPGPAAIGGIIKTNPPITFSKYLGKQTNNFAEYSAVIHALELGLTNHIEHIQLKTDSELIAHQINGNYKVKNKNLLPLYKKTLSLLPQFKSWKIEHIPREKNKEADKLVNEALEKRSRL